jgi:hypothetical protein
MSLYCLLLEVLRPLPSGGRKDHPLTRGSVLSDFAVFHNLLLKAPIAGTALSVILLFAIRPPQIDAMEGAALTAPWAQYGVSFTADYYTFLTQVTGLKILSKGYHRLLKM